MANHVPEAQPQAAQQQAVAPAPAPAPSAPMTTKALFAMPAVAGKFREILGKKGDGFVASVLSVVNNNALLAKAEPRSILNSALLAASLDLPINQNLGFAAIVPFNNGREHRVEGQFQMMTRGYVQLAIRSGQYKTINVTEVRDGEIRSVNRFTGEYEFGPAVSDRIIGYMAYFRLTNGFEKYFFMTVEELNQHAQRFSQTYKRGYGLWVDNFDAMARKTVLKLLLSKFGVLSVQMQHAVTADGGVVRSDVTEGEVTADFVDNVPEAEEATPDPVAESDKAAVAEAMAESVKKPANA